MAAQPGLPALVKSTHIEAIGIATNPTMKTSQQRQPQTIPAGPPMPPAAPAPESSNGLGRLPGWAKAIGAARRTTATAKNA